MQTALCTLDNVNYSAIDFNQTVNFTTIRRHLVCSACGRTAGYRSQGRDGRIACFRATHVDGCEQARMSIAHLTEQPTVVNRRIIVDFNYGFATTRASTQTAGGADTAGTQGDQQAGGNTGVNTSTRRLRPLLSELIGNEDFLRETLTIEVPGQGNYPVAEFFVNFASVTDDHVGTYHGYWGLIPAIWVKENSLYFNSGGPDSMSVLLDAQFDEDFIQRYNIDDLNEIAGSQMLVFGQLKRSRNGKKIVQITDLNDFTLRLAR